MSSHNRPHGKTTEAGGLREVQELINNSFKKTKEILSGCL